MAKEKTRAKVPKRIFGVKIPKPLRRAARPAVEFLGTGVGRAFMVDALVAFAISFASTERMRESFQDVGKRARKSGGIGDLALDLSRAAVLPALTALYAKLPGDGRAEQRADADPGRSSVSSEAVH